MLPSNLSKLAPDENNPREMPNKNGAGLSQSIHRFGDLSGIVYNLKTKHLVCGHQRVAQLIAKYGDLEIAASETDKNAGYFQTPNGNRFPIRFVRWAMAKERAANVAANSPKLQGKFTNTLDEFLDTVKVADAEMFDDLLFDKLLPKESDDDDDDGTIQTSYQVIVECDTEDDQRKLFDELTKKGHACKLSTW